MDFENILVVDDEEAIREVVSTMLESKGYHCTAVSNGRAAQDQVKRATPDLVLSDMIMPEMDGIKLLEWLRQYDPEVPVIMVTAIHDISTALEAIRRGAYDYILKPFEKDQLFLGVGRALQHRRLILENRTYQRNLEQLVEERTAQLTGAIAQLEQSYDDTLEALGSALDLKDAETEGHCQRVTAFCISIAKAMPVPDAYLAVLARAAFLHDIGKMAIPRGFPGRHDQRPPVPESFATFSRSRRDQALLRHAIRSQGRRRLFVHPRRTLARTARKSGFTLPAGAFEESLTAIFDEG